VRALVWLVIAGCTAPGGAVGPHETRVALFEHQWSWTDQDGKTVRLSDWRGSPLVLAPVYTSCSQVCPLTIAKLRKVHEASLREGRAAEFVLVTLDPGADKPSRLHDFKTSEKLPGSWHLLRGSEAATRELLDLLDIHVIDMGSHILHEPRIAVFDGQGSLTKSFRGVDFDDRAPLP
jgi:protein SCO1